MFKSLCAIPLVMLLAPTLNAAVIVVDENTNAEAYAPYVSFQTLQGTLADPTPASLPTNPIGLLVTGPGDPPPIDVLAGFGVFFNVPVTDVTIFGRQVDRCTADDGTPFIDRAGWHAFAADGSSTASGIQSSPGCDELFPIAINAAELDAFVIGTHDGANTIQFERLEFAATVAEVPEPAMLAILGLGITALFLLRSPNARLRAVRQ